jgi:NitT/TauT family transport system permease protein
MTASYHDLICAGRKALALAKRIILVLGFIVGWQLATWLFSIPEYLLPPPSAILIRIYQLGDRLVWHAWITLYEALGGFSLSIIFGITVASLMVHSRFVANVLYPIMVVKQVTPMIVFAPLIVVWIGSGPPSKIFMAFLVAFFPMVVNTEAGLRRVDEDLILMMRGLKSSRWKIYSLIRLPSALPVIFAGMRVSITFAVLGAVVAEFVASSAGLGYLVNEGSNNLDTPLTFAAVVVLAGMGFVMFSALSWLQKVLVPWASEHIEGQV